MPAYKIIGADGREYGPVNADQVRAWVIEGRANGDTRVLPEGDIEWKRLATLPEFASLFAIPEPRPAPALPPVANTQGVAEALGDDIIRRDFNLDVGSCFSRGWELLKARFWLTVGASAIVTLLSSALGSLPAVGTPAILLLNYVLWSGLYWFFLKVIRGSPGDLGDVFAGFTLAFVPLMLYSVVGQLLSGIGLLFCLLPGIYLIVAWTFAGLLIMDKRLEFWPAMELSRRVVTHHFWEFLGLAIVSWVLILLGLLACVIGMFITIPIACAATVYAYEDIFGNSARRRRPIDLLPMTPAPAGARPTPAPSPGPAPAPSPAPSPAPESAPAPGPASAPSTLQLATRAEPADPGPQI